MDEFKNCIIEYLIPKLRRNKELIINLKYEDNALDSIVLDGQKEDFFLSISEKEIDIYWFNEHFIFSKYRSTLTSEDTFGEIIYERELYKVSNQKYMDLILSFMNVLVASLLIKKEEINRSEQLMWDNKKNYIIYLNNKNITKNEITIGNVKFIINKSKR
ncbi:hypothetical protein DV092_10555 [Clostridium botulinum]|uniref:hypothetical protein n=1 Tax=Clostridium sp. ZBS20 TaxID=2949966 RepID=UPI00207AED1D|nr:hypothetical protein [Clostridium sp. ZBS20]MBN1052472.1 hypothetical protein [Clostridium botulinum]